MWVAVGTAMADTISIPLINPSFEQNAAPDGGGVPYALGWVPAVYPGPYTGPYTWNPNNLQFPNTTGSPGTLPSPADGTQYLTDIYTTVDGPDTVAIQGTAAAPVFTLLPHKIYTLTVAAGSPLDRIMDGFRLAFADTAYGGVIADYDYDGSLPNVPLVVGRDVNGNLSPAPTGLWADVSLSINSDDYIRPPGFGIVAGDGMSVSIELGPGACVDNVRLTVTDVPEPSTLALLAVGALVAGAYVWRNQK
jgi:hypothetical protein